MIYGLGGAHNDLIMMLAMMAAVSLTLASGTPTGRREAGAAALGRGRRADEGDRRGAAAVHDRLAPARSRRSSGRAAALALGALVGYAVFGIHGIDVVAALNRDAAFVSTDSFAIEIAHLFGKPGVFPVDHDLLKAGARADPRAPAVAHVARL